MAPEFWIDNRTSEEIEREQRNGKVLFVIGLAIILTCLCLGFIAFIVMNVLVL